MKTIKEMQEGEDAESNDGPSVYEMEEAAHMGSSFGSSKQS